MNQYIFCPPPLACSLNLRKLNEFHRPCRHLFHLASLPQHDCYVVDRVHRFWRHHLKLCFHCNACKLPSKNLHNCWVKTGSRFHLLSKSANFPRNEAIFTWVHCFLGKYLKAARATTVTKQDESEQGMARMYEPRLCSFTFTLFSLLIAVELCVLLILQVRFAFPMCSFSCKTKV